MLPSGLEPNRGEEVVYRRADLTRLALREANCKRFEENAQERLRGSGENYMCVDPSLRLLAPVADFFSILLESDADFIQVPEQVGRVLIDPIGSCPLQLFPAIAPGEQPH